MSNKQDKVKNKEKLPLWQRILDIASWVLLVLTVLVMGFMIFSSITFNKNDRKVFGVSLLVVQSDSMKKTDFAAGDLIFIQEVDANKLKEGDIICFTSQSPESKGKTLTHKIKKIEIIEETIVEKGEQVVIRYREFTTYGTTSGNEDTKPITAEWIKGKYVGKIPAIGHFFNFIKTPAGYITIILVPFVLLIGYQMFNVIKALAAYRGEKTSEIKKERKNLEAERAENLKMLEEMRALKAQLDAMKASAQPVEQSVQQASEIEAPVEKVEEQPENVEAPVEKTENEPEKTES